MRLFLLPISTRRTLIYCERLAESTAKETYLDKGITKAANLWAGWEKKESGWQKQVVVYGNKALKRIPYEEWGLKSLPPLTEKRKEEALAENKKVEISYPPSLIPEGKVYEILGKLGTERENLHKSRILYCFIGMPLVAPFAIVPIVPNLPFFYLVFRAYSHWRAFSGSKHIQFLMEKGLVQSKPSKILDELYSSGTSPFDHGGEEKMLLHHDNGKRIAEALDLPELNIEIDRAVWQVETALEKGSEEAEAILKDKNEKEK